MIRRLFVGLLLGFLIGGLMAAGLVAGLHVSAFVGAGGAVLAYLAAALTGTLTGLFAGKPIWSTGAKVEAGLKAFFGALIGAGLMFALREWGVGYHIDLAGLSPTFGGFGTPGDLPVVSLPLIAAVLAAFFELDNTGASAGVAPKGELAPPERKRVGVAATNGKARSRAVPDEELEAREESSAGPPHAKSR